MRSLHSWPIFPPTLESPIVRSLCLQFILQALLDAKPLLKNLAQSIQHHFKGVDFQNEVQPVLKDLEKLLLFSTSLAFKPQGSALDKLCFYSDILLQTSQLNDESAMRILEELRTGIMLVKSKVRGWQKKRPAPTLILVKEEFLALKESIEKGLSYFFDALKPFFYEARSDENILAFLIESREALNQIVGKKAIEALLLSLFPSGQEQLRAVIHEGYTKRGFPQVLSKIEPLIDQIEWETTCHFPKTS